MKQVLTDEDRERLRFDYACDRDLGALIRETEAKVLERVELLRQAALSGQMSARQVVDHFGNEGQL